jgi:hypothetical protein
MELNLFLMCNYYQAPYMTLLDRIPPNVDRLRPMKWWFFDDAKHGRFHWRASALSVSLWNAGSDTIPTKICFDFCNQIFLVAFLYGFMRAFNEFTASFRLPFYYPSLQVLDGFFFAFEPLWANDHSAFCLSKS